MFLALSAALALGLVLALIAPLVRAATAPAEDVDGADLMARLADIERQRAAGLIGAEDANEAAIEAKRSALAAAAAPAAAPENTKALRFAAVVAAGLLPLAAAILYLRVGAPDQTDGTLAAASATGPAEIAAMPADARDAMIREMVDGLAARLADAPEDAEGWRMLARSRAALGETAGAADALRELLARVEGDADDWRNFAGALMALGPDEGRDTELREAMARLETLRPDDPLALYYFGAEALGAGEREKAALYFERLLARLPSDAPIRPTIEALMKEAKGP